ncbi:hypothetical protein [Bosea thiooxidans]
MRWLQASLWVLLATGIGQEAAAEDCPMPKSVERQRAKVQQLLDTGGAIAVGAVDGATALNVSEDSSYIWVLLRLKVDRILSRVEPANILASDGYVYVNQGQFWTADRKDALFGKRSVQEWSRTGEKLVFPLSGSVQIKEFLGLKFLSMEASSCLSMSINESYFKTGGFDNIDGAQWRTVPEPF